MGKLKSSPMRCQLLSEVLKGTGFTLLRFERNSLAKPPVQVTGCGKMRCFL